MEMAVSNPVVGPFLRFANETLKGIIRKCPYVGNIEVINATLHSDTNKAIDNLNNFQVFPNGQYKLGIKAHSPKDENIATVFIFIDFHARRNLFNGNDDI